MRIQKLKSKHALTMLCLVVTLLTACQASPRQGLDGRPDPEKIRFRIDDIDADGLRGPAGGQVSVSYEFCVPANAQVYRQLRQIDAGLQINPGASGRSGCTKDQALGIGDTGQPGWRRVLDALTSLDYVSAIRECFFE